MKLAVEGQSLRLEGRLDIHSVKEAHALLKGLSAEPQCIDAAGLEGLDTAGVQWLFVLARKHGGALELVNASKAVKSTLKAAGFESWVTS